MQVDVPPEDDQSIAGEPTCFTDHSREDHDHAEVDVSSGDDLAKSEETSEFDVGEYHLPEIE